MIYVINENKRILTLIPSTPSFREMAAVLAVRTGCPLISDCTEIWKEDDVIYARKPSLDGKNFSKYTLDNNTSYVVLLKTSGAEDGLINSLNITKDDNDRKEVIGNAKSDDCVDIKIIEDEKAYEELLFPISLHRDDMAVIDVELSSSKGVHVRDAELIFAGGRGIMNEESFDALRKLADKYGASVGASRPMVDQGWATWDEQIGQTGSIVKPKVYLAFGISGAVQHITGIEKSQNIIAVNLNRNSPIFRYAGYGAYSDDNSIIRNMLNLIDDQTQ